MWLSPPLIVRQQVCRWPALLPLVWIFLVGNLHAWELARSDPDNRIQIYTQPMAGSDFKAYRGTMPIRASLASLIALVDDIAVCPEWIDTCEKGQLLKRVSATETYTYTINKAPWPVSDRDAVVRNTIRQDPLTRRVTIHIHGQPDYIPPVSGLVRVKMITGYWEFTPLGKGWVDVVYQVHNDPGGSLPSWIVNKAAVNQPYKTLLNMQKIIHRPKYEGSHYDFIKE